jgi:hypothetical protein
MALPGLVAANNLSDVVDRERAWDSLGFNIFADYSSMPLGITPGMPLNGGYFAGYISHTADGSPTHALIVAPRATGATGTGYTLTTNLAWKTAATTTSGTTSEFDGVANTAAMVIAGIADHPAAEFCVNLSIGGFTDWYLPSRAELNIAYFNLKPSTAVQETGKGANIYAVPQRNSGWTPSYPTQTTVTAFNTSAERFEFSTSLGIHWSSREDGPANSSYLRLDNGTDFGTTKTTLFKVRAFRRIAL